MYIACRPVPSKCTLHMYHALQCWIACPNSDLLNPTPQHHTTPHNTHQRERSKPHIVHIAHTNTHVNLWREPQNESWLEPCISSPYSRSRSRSHSCSRFYFYLQLFIPLLSPHHRYPMQMQMDSCHESQISQSTSLLFTLPYWNRTICWIRRNPRICIRIPFHMAYASTPYTQYAIRNTQHATRNTQ